MEIITILLFDAVLFYLLMVIGKIYKGTVDINPFDGIETQQERDFLKSAFKNYLISATVQQTVVIGLFYLLKAWFHLPVSILLAICGILFMLAHFPNIILMFSTLGMELLLLTYFNSAGWIFVPFMVFTHSLLATCLLLFFPSYLHRNFKVWFLFFQDNDK